MQVRTFQVNKYLLNLELHFLCLVYNSSESLSGPKSIYINENISHFMKLSLQETPGVFSKKTNSGSNSRENELQLDQI
jgi:hypothetical protein